MCIHFFKGFVSSLSLQCLLKGSASKLSETPGLGMGACRSGANRTSLREDCGGLHGAASRPHKAAAVDLQGALHPMVSFCLIHSRVDGLSVFSILEKEER
jgi:hypothetical protein